MIRRHLVTAFVVWHLCAIVIGAVPPPNQLSHFPPRDQPHTLGPLFDRATAGFDLLARALMVVPRAIGWAAQPIRPAVSWYLSLSGVGQSWAMFSNPPTYDQYVRTRYYVQPPEGRQWMATELVMPANREDRVRLLQSYRDSYRDKAFALALDAFFRRRKPALVAPGTTSAQLPDDLAPIARFFARRFERRLEGSGERIVRIEVWVGNVATPGLGLPADRAALVERSAALQAYYDGPIEQRINVPPYPPYHGGEREADIGWVLEYYEEP
jgi:hypothetical protein